LTEPALHIEYHPAATAPKRVLTIVHGLGEHTRRYRYVADWLNARGTHVLIGDLPGHGQSPGIRGHVDDFSQYIDAACALQSSAVGRWGTGLPHFVLGHSLGGLITALAAPRLQDRPEIRGLLLSSPCFGATVETPAWRLALGRVLVRFKPTLQQPNNIDPSTVTRSPEIAALYGQDPDVLRTVTLGWYFAFVDAMAQAMSAAPAIHLPVGVWQAGADKIVSPAHTRQWTEACASVDKAYQELDGLYHEILNEPERDDVLAAMLTWMTEHEAAPQPV